TNPYGPEDAEAVATGKEVFETICVACHQADGSGLVGPSLVDPYWKYGDSDEAKFVSVHDGRPMGMPPWGAQLGSEKIWKVLAYMETLPESDEPGVGAPGYEAATAGGAAAPGGR
ncbi:MAG: c-type cytochrome, partial [Myxococcota bacterium]|nr:c-type cytochrome [Myxococcota bacterium]